MLPGRSAPSAPESLPAPEAPQSTPSSAGGSLTIVINTSEAAASSRGEAASLAPAAPSGSAREGVRFQTVSAYPAFKRFRPMGRPIRPSPISPTLEPGPIMVFGGFSALTSTPAHSRHTFSPLRRYRFDNALIVTESPSRRGGQASGGLGAILQRENSRSAAGGTWSGGRSGCLGIRGGRRRRGIRRDEGRMRACARCLRGLRGRLRLFLNAYDVLVGNFPPEVLLRAALLEMLLQKDGAARIRNERAGRRQENISGAVLHFNPAPKESRVAGHTVFSFRSGE